MSSKVKFSLMPDKPAYGGFSLGSMAVAPDGTTIQAPTGTRRLRVGGVEREVRDSWVWPTGVSVIETTEGSPLDQFLSNTPNCRHYNTPRKALHRFERVVPEQVEMEEVRRATAIEAVRKSLSEVISMSAGEAKVLDQNRYKTICLLSGLTASEAKPALIYARISAMIESEYQTVGTWLSSEDVTGKAFLEKAKQAGVVKVKNMHYYYKDEDLGSLAVAAKEFEAPTGRFALIKTAIEIELKTKGVA